MYRQDIDALKGISIVAVVLFHMGLLKSGYLGVDVFFVINGFLVIPSLIKKISNSNFSFYLFLEKKIVRLLPLIVIASVVSLILGYFLMLPDHYENLSQSVIAGNLMSENVLSALTTKNYWDVSNEFKPLMHLWYVGILFEFYILFPVLLLCGRFVSLHFHINLRKCLICVLVFSFLLSLLLFILPFDSVGNRFYLIHYRFFEICSGGLIAVFLDRITTSKIPLQSIALFFLLITLLCSLYSYFTGYNNDSIVVIGKELSDTNGLPISGKAALLLSVFFAVFVIGSNTRDKLLKSRVLAMLGKMSYSIFIWHQVLLAFYRYSVSYNMSIFSLLFLGGVTILISYLSYCYIEKKISSSHRFLGIWLLAMFLVLIPSSYLFIHAGVVRDVPELDVVRGLEHRGMFGEYCDRVYNYDKDFADNGKKNVLVVNISFARDFANVLLESPYKDSINLSYVYLWRYPEAIERAQKADYIFSFTSKNEVPLVVWKSIKKTTKVYGIGTKNFGYCNGSNYVYRNSRGFHEMTNSIVPGYVELNNEWKKEWGDNYIDFISPALIKGGRVRVFTPDNKYIAQDCKHFTQAGAKWYASIIDWRKIFEE